MTNRTILNGLSGFGAFTSSSITSVKVRITRGRIVRVIMYGARDPFPIPLYVISV